MEHRKGLILGIVTGLVIAGSFGNASAEHTRPNNGKLAGTFLSSRIDKNNDGIPASWSTGEITGTLGKRSFQSVNEVVPTGPTTECPGGVFIIDAQKGIGFGWTTSTFPNGDQLYVRILTRIQCSLGGGRFEANDTAEILGGTGKFEGASGTGKVHSISITEVFDGKATPPQSFGFFTGEFEGTLILP